MHYYITWIIIFIWIAFISLFVLFIDDGRHLETNNSTFFSHDFPAHLS